MKRIYRSRTDRKLAGICGGLGELFEVDPTLVRLAMVFGTIATGVFPLFITYVIGWWIIPEGPSAGAAA
jgi:phage shock protein C